MNATKTSVEYVMKAHTAIARNICIMYRYMAQFTRFNYLNFKFATITQIK